MWLYISIFFYGFGTGAIVVALILHFSFKRTMRKLSSPTTNVNHGNSSTSGKIIGKNF